MPATGSSAVVAVVPTAATTAQGRRPAARSVAIGRLEQVEAQGVLVVRLDAGAGCSAPNPASSAALGIGAVRLVRGVHDERRVLGLQPAAVLARSVVRSRAQSSAQNVAVLALSWMTPVNVSGRPTIWRSQSMTTSSTSVPAGLVCQLMHCAPRPAATRSASTDVRSVLEGK